MTTKLITAGAVLVVSVLFGFIFWNQFSSNQKDLAGGDSQMTTVNTSGSKNESLGSIETSLEEVDVNVDSDSAQMDSELNGF